MYWDANNLYDWAMIQDLLGHILEVDLEYCKELHDSHSDYPVCSEKLKLVMICCLNIVKTLLIGMI